MSVKRYIMVSESNSMHAGMRYAAENAMGEWVRHSDYAALEAENARLREALAKIAAETPGDTGVDCGRPGGDCHRCEDMIETAQEALASNRKAQP